MTTEWLEVSPGVYMPPDYPQQMLSGVFVDPSDFGKWRTKSLLRDPIARPKGLVRGMRAIDVCGQGIITGGYAPGIYNAGIAFRRTGSLAEPAYLLQCMSTEDGHDQNNGDRDPAYASFVLSEDCSFDYKVTVAYPPGSPPQGVQFNLLVVKVHGQPGLFKA